MHLSPDDVVLWQHGWIKLNSTIITTWALMFVLVAGSWFATRKLSSGVKISRWQNLLEIIVGAVRQQIREIGLEQPKKYIGFLGTLFLFIATCNLCTVFPFYEPPTGSLSTTAALAIAVFTAVPIFGISEDGVVGYVRTYFEPTWLMLPFNIISELTRTLALAVRLFGNIMSGTMIVAILLGITPLFFPINVTLAAFVADLLKSRSSETTILAVGERILGRLEDAGFSIGRTYTVPNSVIGIAPLISQILIDQEKEYANGETYIFHNRPTGAHSYEPVKQRLLPLDAAWQSAFEHIQWPTHLLPEVLGSVESTLRAFVHEYLFVSLFKACAESLASENACRLAAMQSAQRNIDELLGRLRVVYNQTRQTAIDEELFDVVSGFEALRTMNDER